MSKAIHDEVWSARKKREKEAEVLTFRKEEEWLVARFEMEGVK